MLEIDIDDWTRFTDYRGYGKTDRVIERFWACLPPWSAERNARLLQFTTGTSRVPVNAFKYLQSSDSPHRFTIEKSRDSNYLRRSHTCFNRLDLPPYEDYGSPEPNSASQSSACPLYFSSWVVLAHRGLLACVGRLKALGKSKEWFNTVEIWKSRTIRPSTCWHTQRISFISAGSEGFVSPLSPLCFQFLLIKPFLFHTHTFYNIKYVIYHHPSLSFFPYTFWWSGPSTCSCNDLRANSDCHHYFS